MIEHQLAEVHGATLWTDRPQNVGQVLHAELVCRLKPENLELDLHASGAALHLGFSVRRRHQGGALHIHLGRRCIAIVDRLHLVRDQSLVARRGDGLGGSRKANKSRQGKMDEWFH